MHKFKIGTLCYAIFQTNEKTKLLKGKNYYCARNLNHFQSEFPQYREQCLFNDGSFSPAQTLFLYNSTHKAPCICTCYKNTSTINPTGLLLEWTDLFFPTHLNLLTETSTSIRASQMRCTAVADKPLTIAAENSVKNLLKYLSFKKVFVLNLKASELLR